VVFWRRENRGAVVLFAISKRTVFEYPLTLPGDLKPADGGGCKEPELSRGVGRGLPGFWLWAAGAGDRRRLMGGGAADKIGIGGWG